MEHQDETRAAYDGVVELYASMFADRLESHPFSRNMIGTFAELVRGTGNRRAADVGCGPGHLAHYSMIHTPPGELPALLAEQVRVLAPGGLLLVSFFATVGPEPVRFDHKVTPAYSWPVERFAELLAGAGLVTFARLLHDPASERGFLDAHLLARLQP